MAFSARTSSRSSNALGRRSPSSLSAAKPRSALTKALSSHLAGEQVASPSKALLSQLSSQQLDSPSVQGFRRAATSPLGSAQLSESHPGGGQGSRALTQSFASPKPVYGSLRSVPASWEHGGDHRPSARTRPRPGDNSCLQKQDTRGYAHEGRKSVGFQAPNDKARAALVSHSSPRDDWLASAGAGATGAPTSLSPGRYLRKQYTLGGSSVVMDQPPQLTARADPKEWQHTRMRKWEQRMYRGDEGAADENVGRAEQQAHDQSLCEALSARRTASPRARSCDDIASHPSQRRMRAAFTDRAMKSAHMYDHVQLGSPAEQQREEEEAPASGPSPFDMPPAGASSFEASTTRQHNSRYSDPGAPESAHTGRGSGTQINTSSGNMWRSMSLAQGALQEEVSQDESFFRSQLGHRRLGQMSPLVDTTRARSADSGAAGNSRRQAHFDHVTFTHPGGASARGFGGQNVATVSRRARQDWQNDHHKTDVGVCLSPKASTCSEDGESSAAGSVMYVCGSSPPTSSFARAPRGKSVGNDLARHSYWFEPSRSYVGQRRGGRGQEQRPSVEAQQHSINRDAESQNNFRYELIARGEANPRQRSASQPPARNPVTHAGGDHDVDVGVPQRGDTKSRRHANSSSNTDFLLNHNAIANEEKMLQSSRMSHDGEFSRLCTATSVEAQRRSQEVAQVICRNHRQKSSNMAMLLTWE